MVASEINSDFLEAAKKILQVRTNGEAVNLAMRELVVRDQRRIDLSAVLDRPAQPNPGLGDLLSRPSVFGETATSNP